MKKYIKKTFTLMELLAVIAIVSVLFTVMLPGFKKMVKGNAVDQMASQVKLMLEKAQSHAVTSRRCVAVIFPSGTGWNKIDDKDVRLGGARLAFVEAKRGAKTCTFVSWINGEEWRFPIEGASLIRVIDKDDTLYLKTDLKDVLSKEHGKGKVDDFKLCDDNKDALFDVASYDSTGDNKRKCAIVFSPYGEVYNPALKLHIAETLIDNDDGQKVYYPTAVDEFPANFVTLKIHPFCGEVEYVQY